jgi:tetratricopeptide (TPR) repeat protein
MSNYISREVRVFISSTFHDMHEEREVLVKHVFPRLRQKCRARSVELTEVDLRWGVTEAQVEEQGAIRICLEEIDLCKQHPPFFIGILGSRYGEVKTPDDFKHLSREKPEFAWLNNYPPASITELEIVHAIFSRLEAGSVTLDELAKSVHFYVLEPAHFDTRSKPANSTSTDAADKLAALKTKIRASGLPVTMYQKPEDLTHLVLRQLWHAINQRFPKSLQPTPLQQEALEHEAFADSRTKLYIERPTDMQRLDAHVAGDAPPLVIVGESGLGKSALLANWVLRYREKHPADLVIFHFIGSSPSSTDYAAMLRRIMAEIKARFPITEDFPTEPKQLVEKLPVWLAAAHDAKGKTILILDGLNQLALIDNAPNLGWLPQFIPSHVRLLLATVTGTSLDALQKRDWSILTKAPLSTSKRTKLITTYQKRYGKVLSPARVQRIATAQQSANPLYLRVLLDELRVFGVPEQLDELINHYLAAPTAIELYQKVLARLEEDYQQARPNLVKEAFSLLWAARRGLTETELLSLLNSPQRIWSPLFLAVQDALVNRGGQLNFFHDYLRQAVARRYLSTPEQQHACHLQIADYFEKQALNARVADELPWQLEKAGAKERLQACISEIPMFVQLHRDGKEYELLSYWVKLGDLKLMAEVYFNKMASIDWKSPFYRLARFFQVIKPNQTMDLMQEFFQQLLGFLLMARTSDKELELGSRMQALLQRLIRSKHVNTAVSLTKIASLLLRDKSDYAAVEPLYRRALSIHEQVLGAKHPFTAASLNNLALLLDSKGDYATAEPLFRRALSIHEEVLGTEHPFTATSLTNLALLLDKKGDYVAAEPLYRRVLSIQEQVLGPKHPFTANSRDNLALLLKNKGDYVAAEPLLKQTLSSREQVLGTEHLDTAKSLNNLACLLKDKDDYAAAEPLYRRALSIHEQVLGFEHPFTATSLNNLAGLLKDKGDYEAAEPLYRRALSLREQVLGSEHPFTALSLNNLAALLNNKGDYEAAESLYRRALSIRERVLGTKHPFTALSLNNLAYLLNDKGDYAAAEPLYRQALSIREQVLGIKHPDTASSLSSLAGLLKDKGDYEAAEPLYRQALSIQEQVLGTEHTDIAVSLNNLAALLYNKGDYEAAEPLFQRTLYIAKKALGTKHPETVRYRNNLANFFKAKNNKSFVNPQNPDAPSVIYKKRTPKNRKKGKQKKTRR